MKADRQTLQDLDILGTRVGDPGLLDRLDRTRTRGGRRALQRRFTQPLDSVREIRAVQETLRYITEHRTSLVALPDERLLEPLDRYLGSRFVTLKRVRGPSASFESLWIRLRDPDLYREAERGVELVASLLARLDALTTDADAAPPLLAELFQQVRTLLRRTPVQVLRAWERRAGRWALTLIADSMARDEARPMLLQLIDLAHEIDALVSMANVTVDEGYVFPDVVEGDGGQEIAIEGLYHPLVEWPVTNDLRLTHGQRLVFLTGPNMAGKTTYLKAAGIAVLLAHVGMGVPAAGCRLSVMDRLVTAIRTEDDLRAGISYFQAEARRVQKIARSLAEGRRAFVIIDELFRGTNVKDACDASLKVIEAFAGAPTGLFVIASHLIELAPALEASAAVLLMRFEAEMADDDVRFDYRIRSGVSDQRLGMKVLEREGVLASLQAIHAHAVRSVAPSSPSPRF